MKIQLSALLIGVTALSQAQVVSPTVFASPDSFFLGGSLLSLQHSDDRYVTLMPDISRDMETATVTLIVEATAPGTDFSTVSLCLESGIEIDNLKFDPIFTERVEIWNYYTNKWDLALEELMPVNVTDTVNDVRVSIPGHIHPLSGQVKSRITFEGMNYMDRVRIDQFAWDFRI